MDPIRAREEALCARYIRRIRQFPLVERQLGRVTASQVSERVVAALPHGVSGIVQVACVIEAVENEDYESWPQTWFLSSLVPDLILTITESCAESNFLRFQRSRYQELSSSPPLVEKLTHGLTRTLDLSDKQAFIHELVKAGKRQCDRNDEANAPFESGVLHVALSYRHAASYDAGGTIDVDVAEEAFDVLCNFVERSGPYFVRVWIDQNLYRYKDHGPWYQRGFIPYAMFPVISALGKHGGFSIGRRRPWIWVETGMAVSSLGVHCKPSIADSMLDITSKPLDARVGMHYLRACGSTIGASTSLFHAIRQILSAVSWWSTDVLEHQHYEYANEFLEFTMWARAQVVRLDRKDRVDLSSDKFHDTVLETIAWMQALPATMQHRQERKPAYLRLEMNIEKAREQLSLLKLTGKCEVNDGVTEVIGRKSGSLFCFTESDTTVFLNVNPSQRDPNARLVNVEGMAKREEIFRSFREWQGGFSVWDKRFAGKGPPRFSRCGSLFGRYWGLLESIGSLGETVELGGVHFQHDSYMLQGTLVERVYKVREADIDIFLSESDLLCALTLGSELQEKFVTALWPKYAFPAVRRILRVSDDGKDVMVNARTISTSAKDVLFLVERHKEAESVGPKELIVRRARLGVHQYMLTITSNRYGEIIFGFDSVLDVDGMDEQLIGFKTAGDVQMTLAKLRLMMGGTEFVQYSINGLSAGVGIEHKGTERYPLELRLEGSEFQLCSLCLSVFSPVNNLSCVLKSCWASRRIFCTWTGLHKCPKHTNKKACDIVGVLG